MSHLKLSKMLKATIVCLGILGLVFYGVVIPWSLMTFVEQYPEFSYFFLPWLIFLLLTAVPLYVILGLGWSVSGEIGRDMSFTGKNVKSLKGVALCLNIDAAFFFVGNIVFWFLNINYPGVVIAAALFCLFIAAIAVAVKILAYLVEKACAIREENESYI